MMPLAFPSSLALQVSDQLANVPVHPGRERLRLRLGRVPAGHQVPAGRYREDRSGDRCREDDACRGRRRGRGPARRGLRHGRQSLHHRVHRTLRRGREALREALRSGWRNGQARRRPGHHRGQEPPQRRRQPLRPAPQGPRRGVLPHRLGQEPDGGGSAAPHRLLARVRRRRRRRPHRRQPAGPPRRCGSPASARRTTSSRPSAGTPPHSPPPGRPGSGPWAMAGVGLEDLDFAEVHDCFTIAELLMYEAMGLTEPGQGARALEEGWVFKDGKLPVNVSGGLKAKGHPVGATGVSQHVIAAMQLTGTAGRHAAGQPAPCRGAEHGRRGHRQLRQRAGVRLGATRGHGVGHQLAWLSGRRTRYGASARPCTGRGNSGARHPGRSQILWVRYWLFGRPRHAPQGRRD